MMDRLWKLAERWPWLGVVLRVQERFGEINGNQVAAAITLTAFLSLFPLVLVVVAVLGFVTSSQSPEQVANDIVSQLGIGGDAAETLTGALENAEGGRGLAGALGLLLLLYSALGLVAAVQHGINTAWQVKGRGFKDKAVGLGWLLGAGLIFAASFALSAAVNFLPGFLAPLSILIGLGVSFGLFLWSFWLLGNRSVGWRSLVPGAVTAAIGFEILKIVGSVYVPRAVASSSALYGTLGVVFAVLAWLLFFGRLIVYAAVVNVTRYEARAGTVSLLVEAPSIPGREAEAANRSGVVKDHEAAS